MRANFHLRFASKATLTFNERARAELSQNFQEYRLLTFRGVFKALKPPSPFDAVNCEEIACKECLIKNFRLCCCFRPGAAAFVKPLLRCNNFRWRLKSVVKVDLKMKRINVECVSGAHRTLCHSQAVAALREAVSVNYEVVCTIFPSIHPDTTPPNHFEDIQPPHHPAFIVSSMLSERVKSWSAVF